MIIACPECETRFKTSAEAIGPNGRTVRCANCSATWFVPAESADLMLDRLALEDIKTSQNEIVEEAKQTTETLRKGLTGQSKHRESLNTGPVVAQSAIAKSSWTGEKIEEFSARGAHSDMRERTERRRSRRRLWNVMLIWFVPLLLIAALAAGAYYFRQEIVDRVPKSASLYKAVGIEVSAPGLALTPPITRYAQIDGKPVLIVEGSVRNISGDTLSIPLVSLSLHNSSGQSVAQWNVELETASLEARSSASYLSQYPAPPLDAVELRSRFANELQTIFTPVEMFTAPQEN